MDMLDSDICIRRKLPILMVVYLDLFKQQCG